MSALSVLLLLPAQLFFGLEPGLPPEDALARVRFDRREEAKVNDRQALAQNLVRTRFLETLNRFALAPRDRKGELDAAAFDRLVRGRVGDREYVLAFAGTGERARGALSFVFLRVPVPLDGSNEDVSRLSRLRSTLNGLAGEGFVLAPKEKDRFGNVFFWTGRGPRGAKLAAWYVPEHDELRLVLH